MPTTINWCTVVVHDEVRKKAVKTRVEADNVVWELKRVVSDEMNNV